MTLAGAAAALLQILPESLKHIITDKAGVFSDLFKPANFSSGVARNASGDWPEQEQYSASLVPQWTHLLLLAVVVLSIVYLFFDKKPEIFLKPQEWQELPLIAKEVVSHNVQRFRFALPKKKMMLGLPVGAHISLRGTDADGKDVMRPYTPVSDDNLRGYVDFVIKVYPQGKMSQVMERMSPGDRLDFKGPRGKFQYKPNMKRAIGMVAGGSGITPMFQVCAAILGNHWDSTRIWLVYANVAEEDILLREKLDEWARTQRARFQVYYVLEAPPEGWNMGKGRVSKEIVGDHLPLPNEEVMILRCGPPPMNRAVEGLLDKAGFTKEMQFEF